MNRKSVASKFNWLIIIFVVISIPLPGTNVTDHYFLILIRDNSSITKTKITISAKEKERGTGLGLASAYGIIQNHADIKLKLSDFFSI